MYNRCTGICKFGNHSYHRRIRRRSNLGHIFREKSAFYGPGNTVLAQKHLLSTLLLEDGVYNKTKHVEEM